MFPRKKTGRPNSLAGSLLEGVFGRTCREMKKNLGCGGHNKGSIYPIRIFVL
jgi:hypothetical protein